MLKITAVRFAPRRGEAIAHVYITDGDHAWKFTQLSHIRAVKASDISPDAVRLDTGEDYHVEIRRASVGVGEYRKARTLACKAMAHAYTAFDKGRPPAVSLRRGSRLDADVLDAVIKRAGRETASKALLLLGAYDAEQAYHAEQASLRRDAAARNRLDPETPEWEAEDLWRRAEKSDEAAQEARGALNSAAHTMSLIGLLPGFISFHGCIDVTEALWGDYAPTRD